jgi:hypothetical protein
MAIGWYDMDMEASEVDRALGLGPPRAAAAYERRYDDALPGRWNAEDEAAKEDGSIVMDVEKGMLGESLRGVRCYHTARQDGEGQGSRVAVESGAIATRWVVAVSPLHTSRSGAVLE